MKTALLRTGHLRALTLSLFALTVAPFVAQCAIAADDKKVDEAAKEMVTKVYYVADLVFAPANYPLNPSEVEQPAAAPLPVVGRNGRGGGFGGGGGFFSVPDGPTPTYLAQAAGAAPVAHAGYAAAQSGRPLIDQLIDVIQTTIGPSTIWRDVNPDGGTIVAYGGRLIVTQTPDTQAEIAKLLSALRTQGGAQSTVTVRAWWLQLDHSKYQKLVADIPSATPPLVNRKQLDALAGENGADCGEITCFDGQTVHMISGRFRNSVTGVTPVVGQLEQPLKLDSVPVQLAAVEDGGPRVHFFNAVEHKSAPSAGITLVAGEQPSAGKEQLVGANVGYMPNVTTQHAGAVLEVTPTRLPEARAVLLDVKSIVRIWGDQTEKPVEFQNIVQLDRANVTSQELYTTLRIPVAKPVLAGGLSLTPGRAADGNQTQLYLVLEVIDDGKSASDGGH